MDLGSLYTNVIPPLLINGVTKAIKESTAIKVYVSNIMTEPGQTDNYTVSEHINAIIEHCGIGVIDYCIYDTGEIVPEFIKKYNMEGQDLVEQDVDKVKGIKFLQRNLSMIKDELIRHDPSLVASSIIELICDDLRYQDKQNDPQYLILSNKLREEKRINKIKKKKEKKDKKIRNGKKDEKVLKSKSKFSTKYSDRIASIREADKKAEAKSKQREKKGRTRTKTKKDVKNKETTTNRKTQERKTTTRKTPAKKKTPQEIREEMLKQLENSKLKDKNN